MRFKLRTLLILLAVLPPLLWVGWTKYEAWKAEQERRAAIEMERAARLNLQGILVAPSVTFSADGKRLVSAGDGQTVRVWDAVTGQEILTVKGHSTADADPNSAGWSSSRTSTVSR